MRIGEVRFDRVRARISTLLSNYINKWEEHVRLTYLHNRKGFHLDLVLLFWVFLHRDDDLAQVFVTFFTLLHEKRINNNP